MKTIEEAAQEYAKSCDLTQAGQTKKQKAFEAGAAFAQQWISVDDELPENSDDPIEYLTKNEDNKVSICYFRNNIFWSQSYCRRDNVTHWRPITINN